MKNQIDKYDQQRHLQLTLEDIDSVDEFKGYSEEEKQELISLVYVLCRALWESYAKENE